MTGPAITRDEAKLMLLAVAKQHADAGNAWQAASIVASVDALASPAPAIDLEQFRVAVEAYKFEGECKLLEFCFGPEADKQAAIAQIADGDRLLALIDGQAAPGCGACGDGCVMRGSCRVRDESPPCNSELPTKGEGVACV